MKCGPGLYTIAYLDQYKRNYEEAVRHGTQAQIDAALDAWQNANRRAHENGDIGR
jgi:hypothetical protein